MLGAQPSGSRLSPEFSEAHREGFSFPQESRLISLLSILSLSLCAMQCFKIYGGEQVTWPEAKRLCEAEGGVLAVISNLMEQGKALHGRGLCSHALVLVSGG